MESHSAAASSAVRPVAPYIGGKRNLASRVIERIEQIPHELYAEPFVGMGGVFLRRPNRAKCEVINDLSGDVANFFRVLQRHYNAFMDMLSWQVTSREHFERLVATPAESLTDLERAARFLYLQRLAFGGKVSGRNFGVSRTSPARFDVTKLTPMLTDVHERLAGVTIERMRWADLLRRYDRPGALFYLDPPYFGCEGDYGKELFDRSEFQEMAELLDTIKGSFILSLNDLPEVRCIFARFTIEAVPVRYSVGGAANAGVFGEVIISKNNFVTEGGASGTQ